MITLPVAFFRGGELVDWVSSPYRVCRHIQCDLIQLMGVNVCPMGPILAGMPPQDSL